MLGALRMMRLFLDMHGIDADKVTVTMSADSRTAYEVRLAVRAEAERLNIYARPVDSTPMQAGAAYGIRFVVKEEV